MISKSTKRIIRSLQQKKYRDENGLYLAEGSRIISEILKSRHEVTLLAATGEWIAKHSRILSSPGSPVFEVTPAELKSVSSLTTPNEVLAVVRKPVYRPDMVKAAKRLSLALDNIQDPGNLGTIVRLADWFGISDVFCSPVTADIYNPKVIQSAMGSHVRVHTHYLPLEEVFRLLPSPPEYAVYGTFPEGEPVYTAALSPMGMVLLGNEAAGISKRLFPYIHKKISIPAYGSPGKVDSLNVSVAAAVICSEFRRREWPFRGG